MLQINEKDRDRMILYIRKSVPVQHTNEAVMELVRMLMQLKPVTPKKKKKAKKEEG